MNILEVQDKLKGLSEQQLAQEMQTPSGMAPQFLVLTELQRRKRVRDEFAGQQSSAPTATVAQEAVAAAGVPQEGIGQMARALAPQTSVAQNTGIGALMQQAPTEEPQRMAEGGLVKMAEGRIVRGGVVYELQPDGTYLGENGRRIMSAGQDLTRLFEGYGSDEPTPDDGLTWGQRNIGVPLRETFAPVGDALRSVGQPVGDTLRSIGQPIGDTLSDVGAGIMADAPRFVLGAIPEEPPAPPPPPAPTLDRRAQFEPVGDGMGLDLLPPEVDPAYHARMVLGAKTIPEILDANVDVLTPEQAAQAMLDMEAKAARDDTLADATERGSSYEDDVRAALRATNEAAAKGETTPEETAPDAPPAAPLVDNGGGGAGGGSGSSSVSVSGVFGESDYEREIAAAIARSEKRAEQDKWLALAQAGMALMSSKQPTLGGALGEAGLVGLEQYRGSRNEAEASKLDLLKTQFELDLARQKMALAARSGGSGGSGGSGSSPYKISQYVDDLSAQSKALGEQMAGMTIGGQPIPAQMDEYERISAIKAQIDNQLLTLLGVRQSAPAAPTADIVTPR